MTNHVMTNIPRSNSRQWMLSTVSAMAIGASLTGQAVAQDATAKLSIVAGTFVPSATGNVAQVANVVNNGPLTISASVNSSAISTTSGSVPGSSYLTTVSTNTVSASVGGNAFTNVVSVSPLPLMSTKGIGQIGSAVNRNTTITSAVGSNTLGQTLTDVTSQTVLTDNNTISATTNLNTGSNTVSGSVPSGFASTTKQETVVDTSSTTLPITSQGTIAQTSVQQNYASGPLNGSNASATSNTISQSISNTTGSPETVSGGVSLSGNTISATFSGNSAQNLTSLLGGTDPLFNGAVAVTNFQLNSDSGTATKVSSLNDQSNIVSGIRATSSGSETLTGSLTIDGNTISSSATGNLAAGANGSGNVIQLADGLSYSGTNSAPADGPVSTVTFSGGAINVKQSTDLSVVNVQGNTPAPVSAVTSGVFSGNGVIGAKIDNVVGGTVSLSENQITSAATGNGAFNAIQAPGEGTSSTASFTGTAGITSLQDNSGSPVTAQTTDMRMGVNLAPISTGQIANATVTVDSNRMAATAIGSSVGNVLNVSATQVEANVLDKSSAVLPGSVSGNRTTSIGTVTGGLVIQSQQNNEADSPVSATLTNGRIGIGAAVGGALSDSALSMDQNTLEAIGVGNTSNSAINVAATGLNGTAALLNAQTSHSDVSASVLSPRISTDPDSGAVVLNTDVTQNGNLVRAIAEGNASSNNVSIAATNVTLAAVTPTNTATATLSAGVNPIATASTSATFVAANNQEAGGEISALVDGSTNQIIETYASTNGAGVTGSTINQNGNAIVAAARGNTGDTSVNLSGVTALTPTGGNSPSIVPIASAQSVQALQSGSSVSATVSGYDVTTDALVGGAVLSTISAGPVNNSSITAQSNTIQALANGNEASTAVSISQAGTISDPQNAGLAILSQSGVGLTNTVTSSTMLSAQNVQGAIGSTVNATLTAAGIDPSVLGTVTGSNLSIGGYDPLTNKSLGNTLSAQANANTANTDIALQATTLQTTAGVQSSQASTSAVGASITGGALDQFGGNSPAVGAPNYSTTMGITVLGSVVNSALSTQLNNVAADGTANYAANTLNAAATNISVPDGLSSSSYAGSTATSTAALSVQNTQSAASTVSASQTGTGAVTGASGVINGSSLQIGGTDPQTGASLGNTFATNAKGNNAVNSIIVAATNLDASSTLSNVQRSSAAVTATTGTVGSPAYPAGNYTYTYTLGGSFTSTFNAGSYDIYSATTNSAYMEVLKSSLSAPALADLSSTAGWNDTGTTLRFYLPTSGSTPVTLASLPTPPVTGSVPDSYLAQPAVLPSVALVIFAGNNILNGRLVIDNNAIRAIGVGNQAANTSTVAGDATVSGSNGVNTTGMASAFANSMTTASADHSLLNDQLVTGSVKADAFSYNGIVGLSTASGISGSTLSVSGNRQLAAAEGNLASNELAVSGGQVGTVANPITTALASSQVGTLTAVSPANAISASSQMWVEAPGYMSTSSLELSRNSNAAMVMGNDVANTLSVSATNLDGQFRLVTYPGPITVPDPNVTAGTGVPGYDAGGVADPGWAFAPTLDHSLANAQYLNLNGSLASSATTSVRNNDAVILGATDVGGSLTNSTVGMDGNSTLALTVGNRATENSVAITASANNTADAALANSQTSAGGNLSSFASTATSSVNYAGGVGNGAGLVSGSSVSLSSNTTTAQTVVNSAVNTLRSDAGANQSGMNALASDQLVASGTGVSATATGNVAAQLGGATSTAPSSATNSTITLSGNAVQAVATANEATNRLVSDGGANNSGFMNVDAYVAGSATAPGGTLSWGSNALANSQSSGGAVNATASSTVTANVGTVTGASGTVGSSSVSLDGNSSLAQAMGNNADSTLEVNAGANLSATAALVSQQFNSGGVAATAGSSVRAAVGTTTQASAALSGSTIGVTGNVTQAMATGNNASNVLDATAGAGYNVTAIVNKALAGSASAPSGPTNAYAAYALGNFQNNSGGVSATANGTNYQVALNALPATAAAQNSTINLSGNVVQSQAYGNRAYNQMTMSALNTGAPTMALVSNQVNTGNISASSNGATLGINIAGATSASTLRQIGNTLSAGAVGNMVSNVITAR